MGGANLGRERALRKATRKRGIMRPPARRETWPSLNFPPASLWRYDPA